MDRGIEPLCQDWESCILTIRWIHHYISARKLGDSNPRYGNPYGSLANCWFQPLTQTSFPIVIFRGTFSQMRCKGMYLFSILQMFLLFFLKISLWSHTKPSRLLSSHLIFMLVSNMRACRSDLDNTFIAVLLASRMPWSFQMCCPSSRFVCYLS